MKRAASLRFAGLVPGRSVVRKTLIACDYLCRIELAVRPLKTKRTGQESGRESEKVADS